MDVQLVQKGLDFSKRKKKWVVLLAALGFTGYGAYRVYHLPSVVEKRNRVARLLGALISITEAIADSAEAIGVVTKDMKEFLQSDSDQIPKSVKQISKVTRSQEFTDSVIKVTQALTIGILRGYESKVKSDVEICTSSTFLDQVLDKLFTEAGSGFASAVVGSFTRNLVMAFFSEKQASGVSYVKKYTIADDNLESGADPVPNWLNVVSSSECRELVGDCIQLFVSTAVTVFLDKTMHINTYDQFFSGLTNPNHETEVREILVSVCNGAVETLVRTSHEVLKNSNSDSSSLDLMMVRNEQKSVFAGFKKTNPFGNRKDGGWVHQVSSTLAAPCNRKFVLDMTGQVTFATIQSFLEFIMGKLLEHTRKCLDAVHDGVVDRGKEVARYVIMKSSVIATLCLSLCLHILDSPWVLVQA